MLLINMEEEKNTDAHNMQVSRLQTQHQNKIMLDCQSIYFSQKSIYLLFVILNKWRKDIVLCFACLSFPRGANLLQINKQTN